MTQLCSVTCAVVLILKVESEYTEMEHTFVIAAINYGEGVVAHFDLCTVVFFFYTRYRTRGSQIC